MSAIGNLIGDTGSMGKHIFNIFLTIIVLFVAKHFLSDFGLRLYKMYYGVEGMTSSVMNSDCIKGCSSVCNKLEGCDNENTCQDKYPNISMEKGWNQNETLIGYEVCNAGCSDEYKRSCSLPYYSPSEGAEKAADAAIKASQDHEDALKATNEVSINPGPAIGSWGNNNDSGVPDGSVASDASSSNLATQQIIPGSAYPSNATVANMGGLYPSKSNLDNIQGGNAPQTMSGVTTAMAPSPLAPVSSELASKANEAISRNIRGTNEQDAAIDISINMKMSEHVAKNLVGSVPQYTNPTQYASGRTTGLNNNNFNPYLESMPQESLGTTYDNRLGGNYPSYVYNTQNNTGTAYTNQYKPVNPGKKPKPYNSLMDLFR
jgi:hypothetical protein